MAGFSAPSIDWGPLVVQLPDGQVVKGVRPGLLPKPFLSVHLARDGRVVPPDPPRRAAPVSHFEACASVALDLQGEAAVWVYKLTAVYADGARHHTLVEPGGLRILDRRLEEAA